MNTNFSISEATLQDIPALAILINSAYRGETSKKGWTTEADFLGGNRIDKEALHEIMAKPTSVILKVEDSTGIVGCVYLEKQHLRLYLGMLTVSPGLQNSGMGKHLLKAAEEYALKNGCNSIKMTVISIRTSLIEWYKRHGYTLTDKTEPFPTDPRFGIPKQPLHFIVMEKSLN